MGLMLSAKFLALSCLFANSWASIDRSSKASVSKAKKYSKAMKYEFEEHPEAPKNYDEFKERLANYKGNKKTKAGLVLHKLNEQNERIKHMLTVHGRYLTFEDMKTRGVWMIDLKTTKL